VPSESDEIRQRLDTMERRMNSLESRVNSEASLRAMMDLDQATLTTRLDAQDNLLRALAVTQSEHTSQLRRLDERLTGVDERLTGVNGTVTRVETGVQAILQLLREDK
jgi:tetrahydromethanopterin S-methyltransferase subunit G